MSQIGGKDAKRHFTVVMGGKEHGLYVSSTPSSAARKAVTKLCTANKSKKVEFSIREITQGSKKKTYGPYEGHIEKLKEPIELKGRVIKYKPVAKLSGKTSKKMVGGNPELLKKIDDFKSKNVNLETTKQEASELVNSILEESNKTKDAGILIQYLDFLYYLNSYEAFKNIRPTMYSVFQIVKKKYDEKRAINNIENYPVYPKVYKNLTRYS